MKREKKKKWIERQLKSLKNEQVQNEIISKERKWQIWIDEWKREFDKSKKIENFKHSVKNRLWGRKIKWVNKKENITEKKEKKRKIKKKKKKDTHTHTHKKKKKKQKNPRRKKKRR